MLHLHLRVSEPRLTRLACTGASTKRKSGAFDLLASGKLFLRKLPRSVARLMIRQEEMEGLMLERESGSGEMGRDRQAPHKQEELREAEFKRF